MDLSSRHKVSPEMNMSSMTDVIFLLLIFFMLTSNVVTTGKRANVPSSNQPIVSSQKVMVEVDKDGLIYVDDKKVVEAELKSVLANKIASSEDDKIDNAIIIRGDKDADYGTVIEVFNIASEIDNATAVLGFKAK